MEKQNYFFLSVQKNLKNRFPFPDESDTSPNYSKLLNRSSEKPTPRNEVTGVTRNKFEIGF